MGARSEAAPEGNQEGAALVEACILVPVFVLLLAGTLFLSHRFEEKLWSASRVRSCALRYSRSGCAELPKECQALKVIDTGNTALSGSEDDALFESVSQDLKAPDGIDALVDTLGPIAHVLASALALKGEHRLTDTRWSQNPAAIGGGNARSVSTYAVMCNEKTRTGMELIRDLWRKVL